MEVDDLDGALARVRKARIAIEYGPVSVCVLPDMAPLDWVAAIRGAAPHTPLVLHSGTVVRDDLEHLARDWGAVAVLEKAFKPTQLVAAVREAVARDNPVRPVNTGQPEPGFSS